MGAPALFFAVYPPPPPAGATCPLPAAPGRSRSAPRAAPPGSEHRPTPRCRLGAVRLHKSRGHKGGDLCPRPLAGGGRPPFRPLGPPPPVDHARGEVHSPFSRNGPFHPALSAAAGSEIRAHPAHRERGRPSPLRARTKSGRRRRTAILPSNTPPAPPVQPLERPPPARAAGRPSTGRQSPGGPGPPTLGKAVSLACKHLPVHGGSPPRAAPPGSGQRPAALYRQMAPVRFAPTPRREL